jgi:threonine dehydratase
LNHVLGPNDDIAHFEYSKKTARERGPALVGIELRHKEDFEPLLTRMKEHNMQFEYINNKPDLFEFLI